MWAGLGKGAVDATRLPSPHPTLPHSTPPVYLVETLEAAHDKHDNMTHLSAVCLLRPTPENVRTLVGHLREPKFKDYHIFFTNIVSQDLLRKLADADHMQVVKQVAEYYADFYAVNGDLFSLSLGGSLSLSRPRSQYSVHENAALQRSTQGLLAVLLALKMKPYVRFAGASEAAQAVAREITGCMGGERELFTFQRTAGSPMLVRNGGGVCLALCCSSPFWASPPPPPILQLVLDRRDDPVTPLLSQWTYQAMVHELIPGGIKNNLVDLRSLKGVSKDLEQVVLSPSADEFFKAHAYSNYGDLGAAIKAMLDEYTAQRGGVSSNISSVEDMQRFVDAYPELRARGLTVGKHVALMGELASIVDAKRLLELSEIEQSIAASDKPNDQFKAVAEAIKLPGVDPLDGLRLLLLFALRYEKSRPDKVAELRRLVSDTLDVRASIGLVDTLMAYGGAGVRGGELFQTAAAGGGGVLSKLTSTVKRGLTGVANVFTQHEPYLVSLLDGLARGKLSRQAFPFVGAEPPPGKVATVVVFMVGGTTFEEAAAVSAINAGTLPLGGAVPGPNGVAAPPFRVILGGTSIHNSKSFLAELKRLHDGSVVVDVA